MSSESPDTRARILDAALALLEAGGGAGVRMSDIARAAGVSRQAVYLHFENRADLMVAALRRLDERLGIEARLAESRAAPSGEARLMAWIAAWGGYLPEIAGVARAVLAMRGGDAAAAAAWDDRMAAMRAGCAAALRDLERDGALAPGWDHGAATDLLWTLLSVPAWELLTGGCGWRQDAYVARMQDAALRLFLRR